MVRYLEKKTREKHFSSRELGSGSGAAAAKGKSKGKETVYIAYDEQRKVRALEEKVWDETRSREHARIQKEKEMVRDRQAFHDEFLGKSDTPDQKKSFRKGKPANMLRFFVKNLDSPQGNQHWDL